MQEDGEGIERGFLSYEGGGFDLRLVVEWDWLTACLFKKNLCEFGDYRTVLRDVSLLLFFFPVEYFSISLVLLQGYSIRLGLLRLLQRISRHPINLCFSLFIRIVSTLIHRSIPRLQNGS